MLHEPGNSHDTLIGDVAEESSAPSQQTEEIGKTCSEIGLALSLRALARPSILREKDGATIGDVSKSLHHLQTTITDELTGRLFMYLPPERAAFYDRPELLGKEVNAKFPSIQFDVVEAGNCYAAGRGTAVVFHLMRMMETGVQAFGTKLGVALADEKNWQNILDEIDKAIRALPKTPESVKMSQASANLYAVKLAWRNEVMHPKDTYTLEEADNLIRQVRIFMEQLATII
jgi:hypothetical protein